MFVWIRSIARIPATIFGFVVCLISYALHLSLPKTNGALSLPGLRSKVEVIRDRWGVPHIFARNNHDLFFALGFIHAQDRLWQMEFSRRLVRGTLSEILGKEAVATDRFMRRIGLWRSATSQIVKASRRTKTALAAYGKGINAYLSITPRWRFPIEFILLRFKPKPWSVVDSAALGKLIGWVLSPNWDSEIVRLRLIKELGPEIMHQIEPRYPYDGIVTIPPGASCSGPLNNFLKEYRELNNYISQCGASNVWAVGGKKSASSKPLLACDPHLPSSMPSFWYEVHLLSPRVNAIGASVPGLPVVILGHNSRIAWGISAGLVDQKDVYIEQLNPGNQNQYLYEGTWRDAEHLTECINVRGMSDPIYEDILVTHHGPVISPLLENESHVLSVRSVEIESLGLLESGYGIMTANNWGEFRRALSRWSSPSMNFIYADTEGNIGYQLAGFVPVRGERSSILPSFGWEEKNEWSGFIPFDNLPSALNPKTNFFASANNMVSCISPYGQIFGEWADPYRASRIVDLLKAKEVFSFEDFRKMHCDTFSIPADKIIPYVAQVDFQDKEMKKIADTLIYWDCRVEAKSVEASIFEVFAYHLYKNFFSEMLGKNLEYYMGKGIHEMARINTLGYRASSNLVRFLRETPCWWSFGEGVTIDEIIRKSLEEAIAYLKSALGEDRNRWQWGRIHSVTFPHIFGRNRILRRVFNRGPYPLGGDANTIPQASYDPTEPFNCTASIVSYRQIIDLGDLDKSFAVNSTGASGQPGSRHFDDQITLWRDFDYHPMLFGLEAIQKHSEATLVITPT